MGKFLRIFFGCHARPDRSFYYKGKQFPICARCTGELVGMIAAVFIAVFVGRIPVFWCIILTIPILIDGIIQLKTKYESNNIKRLITGIMFGVAFVFFLIHFHLFMVNLVRELLTKIVGSPPPYIHLFGSN